MGERSFLDAWRLLDGGLGGEEANGHLGGWVGWCGDKATINIITAIMESLSCLSPPLSLLLTGQRRANLRSTSSLTYLV